MTMGFSNHMGAGGDFEKGNGTGGKVCMRKQATSQYAGGSRVCGARCAVA